MKTKHDSIFDPYLSKDETILWVGRPNPLWLFVPYDILFIPFSLFWGNLAFSWEAMVTGNGNSVPNFLCLWGLPFVIMGHYAIWGRFIHKYLTRRNTYYALTNRRVLVLTKFFGTDLKTYFLHQATSLQRKGRAVIFEIDSGYGLPIPKPRRQKIDWYGEALPGFYALADADDVHRMMQDLVTPDKVKNA